MKTIRMVDLLSQYEKIGNEIDSAIIDVIRSSAYINGPEVKKFQSELEEYLNVKQVVPCASGTDALQIAMMALDLQLGDEVIAPSLTYMATVEAIALLKLKPVLVDVDKDTFCIDTEQIRKAITSKTKAIIPVHLFGQCVNMDEVMEMAKEHYLYVIEDTAQAIGAEYTFKNGEIAKAGTIGHLGTTSFFPSKNLGCYGDGGAIFTNDDQLATRLRMTANHGQSKKYYQDNIGINSRLDTIQAAVLRKKLPHLNEYNAARNSAAAYYNKAFSNHPNIKPPFQATNSSHVYHQYTLQVQGVSRDELKEYLNSRNIPSVIYYPVPVHKQRAYRHLHFNDSDFPVTNELTEKIISLPMHSELNEEQLEYISRSVLEFVSQNTSK